MYGFRFILSWFAFRCIGILNFRVSWGFEIVHVEGVLGLFGLKIGVGFLGYASRAFEAFGVFGPVGSGVRLLRLCSLVFVYSM